MPWLTADNKGNQMNVLGGHFLKGDVASFDAGFFGFPADQAAVSVSPWCKGQGS